MKCQNQFSGKNKKNISVYSLLKILSRVCLFVLRFYSPVNPMVSCRALTVDLTTRLLGRPSPLSS